GPRFGLGTTEFVATLAAVFQVIGQTAEHAGDFHSQRMALTEQRLSQILLIPRNVELGAHLTARPFGDIEELEELSITSPFESFSDIGEDRDCRSPDLVHQAVVASKPALPGGGIDRVGQFARLLP